jgi:hypothetical protein
MPAQARTEVQDVAGAVRSACSKCSIIYYTPNGYTPFCPLCDAERRIRDLQAQILKAENAAEVARGETRRIQAHVDIVLAIREALDITSEEDLVWLKSVLYRWRDHKAAVQLKILHAAPTGRNRNRKLVSPPPNGLLADFKDGEPEAHLCTSIGGIAIAGYYGEAWRHSGQASAMESLYRALSPLLTPPS